MLNIDEFVATWIREFEWESVFVYKYVLTGASISLTNKNNFMQFYVNR